MGLDLVTVRLLLIFFPGIICSIIIQSFTDNPKWSNFKFITNSFVLGVFSYAIYDIFSIFGLSNDSSSFIAKILLPTKEIAIGSSDFLPVFPVTIISLILGLLLTGVDTHKLHFKILQRLKLTKKSGLPDTWAVFMNIEKTGWILVRDIKNNLIYAGWLESFSQDSKNPEVLLSGVNVYTNSTAMFLYKVDLQYLKLDSNNIQIEVIKNQEIDAK